MPHERFQGSTKLGFRGDAIVQLDWCVGEVMKSLEKHGVAENTLVIFCSDNGPVMDDGYKDEAIEKVGKHRAGGPYTGGKYSVYEGGCRTPFITHWPARIKPGVSDQMVCTIDIAASMAALTNQTLAENACIDSFDVLDAIVGKDGSKGRDSLILQDNGNKGNWSYIKLNGDKAWKIHRYDHNKAFNVVVEEKLTNTPKDNLEFYEINTDPSEQNKIKISDETPIAKQMAAELQSVIDEGDAGKGTRPR
jgi:arylsulfatase A